MTKIEHCGKHHTECKFGQWFYSTGAQSIIDEALGKPEHVQQSVRRLWKEIEEHHIAFHHHSIQAIQKIHALKEDTEKESAESARLQAAAADETQMMIRSTKLNNRLLELDALLYQKTHHHLNEAR
ncbi:hypothetical protein B1757_04710 [Acidithiobacillus marinus]|uniref:Chemoreceptor zinc-binding domain-containing protein n=1 Tax=Acidithiobacillus marinus TaxID=187490 RepID=A0A2I1DNC8_9PROT|nr:CZB domain-containing protein [Acidithiobacillus marinus]PKY11390.1 hypothetical protein B1757_04710 [Acidithiobacillus marinus]